LQGGADLPLAEVAAHAGFCDQSQFSHHFKRLLGVTPGQFRTRIRNAEDDAISAKNPDGEPLRILSGSGANHPNLAADEG
jgi:AraC-like DNA-binding protein